MSLEYKSTEVYLQPDVRYRSVLVSKMINCLMHKGKKSVAEKLVYQAMDHLKTRFEDKEPLEILETAINNVKPLVEVKSRRVGGATYQVPIEVSKKRQMSLAIRWMIEAVRNKKGKAAYLKFADEISDAYKRQGVSVTKRENTHKMAEANKAFAHFGWSRY
ncbi:MAG: 30S ribosomal protein S7 [Candidatus Scalindua sp.]|nr:30S ribosomal protein S7 [Candidatus Scalindua sp.]